MYSDSRESLYAFVAYINFLYFISQNLNQTCFAIQKKHSGQCIFTSSLIGGQCVWLALFVWWGFQFLEVTAVCDVFYL